MKVFIIYISTWLKSIIRKFYWLYRLNQAKLGNNIKIGFPIVAEGKGRLIIGDNSTLEQRTKFKLGKDSSLNIGSNSLIEKNSELVVMSGCNLKTGGNLKIGQGSRLNVQENWILGENVTIETFSVILSREPGQFGKLSIGNNSSVGDGTIMDLSDDIIIENDVAIGPNCTFYTHDHDYTDKSQPAWKGGLYKNKIIVRSGAWIGANVTVLPGVTIGRRSVVATGSIVNKDVSGESVVAGVPAKLIKNI